VFVDRQWWSIADRHNLPKLIKLESAAKPRREPGTARSENSASLAGKRNLHECLALVRRIAKYVVALNDDARRGAHPVWSKIKKLLKVR